MSKIDEIIEKYRKEIRRHPDSMFHAIPASIIYPSDVKQIIKEVLEEIKIEENDAKEIGILNTTNLDRVGGFNQAREIQNKKIKELFEEVKE